MTTTLRRRSAILAGLFLLSLVVLATSLDESWATRPLGTGATSSGAATAPTQAQALTALVKHVQLDGVHAAAVPAAAATAPTSVSTWVWVALAVALAALAIGVWALAVRRRSPRPTTSADAFCTLHPQDARCPAA